MNVGCGGRALSHEIKLFAFLRLVIIADTFFSFVANAGIIGEEFFGNVTKAGVILKCAEEPERRGILSGGSKVGDIGNALRFGFELRQNFRVNGTVFLLPLIDFR